MTTIPEGKPMSFTRLPDDFDPDTYDGEGAVVSTIGLAVFVDHRTYAPIPEDMPAKITMWFMDNYDAPHEAHDAMIEAVGNVFRERFPWATIRPPVFNEDGEPITDVDGDEVTESGEVLTSGFANWRENQEKEIAAMQEFVDKYGDYLILDPATPEELEQMNKAVEEHVARKREQDEAIQRLMSMLMGQQSGE